MRIKLFRCQNSWRPSNLTLRNLPASTNKRSVRVPSSGSSSRRCVPPLESTHLPLAKAFGQRCLVWVTSITSWVCRSLKLCLALKHRNGGLITLDELHHRVLKGRGKFAQDVSQGDLVRAIKKLKAMGNGFGMIPVGSSYLVQSVPAELNMDHTVVLQLAEEHLLIEGLAWLDSQASGEPHYGCQPSSRS
uniref:Vacuolar-sorting protein SNF8 n=1 Tax=Salmo trutta TaxID=8032 RepID=A0A673Y1T6_SALTR